MAEIVFYRHKHGKLLDHVIGWLTWGAYSHVEFVLRPALCPVKLTGCRLGISSSWRDGGVRKKTISVSSGKWTRYQIAETRLDKATELAIARWLEQQIGKKYDTLGVLLTPFSFWTKKLFRVVRWFCSEICTYCCKHWEIFDFPTTQISPNRMERYCRANPEVFFPLNDSGVPYAILAKGRGANES